ncbi:hypothetical protein [Plantactinospora sp. KLBMP9567]|uniref:hypothetical protein n=1 Tax=unclassified Plantactinospora TaxID=2631981 RepID=UPI003990BAFA
MSPFFMVFGLLLLVSASYAAGRLHGQLSYRLGYRFGYRQGYFDGDRGAWNRRRREAQAAIASVLAVPSPSTPHIAHTVVGQGTTYTGASFAGTATNGGRHSTDALAVRNA